MKRRRKSLIVRSVFGLVGIVIIFYLVPLTFAHKIDRPFNSAEWQDVHRRFLGNSPINESDYRRAEMVEDLLRNHLHIGMRRTEVLRLLGEGAPSYGEDNGTNVGTWDSYSLVNDPPYGSSKLKLYLRYRYGNPRPDLVLEYHGKHGKDELLTKISIE